jgi:methylated-DNA-[protein]-cysteine S-methyltransferase
MTPAPAHGRPAAGATAYTTVDSPIGELMLVGGDDGLAGVYMTPHRHGPELDPAWRRDPAPFAEAARQLEEYFAGDRTEFDLALDPRGTEFQQRVWALLREIPYGETTTYGALAERLGNPRTVRAVGLANGRNPISIVVPCHRVIGSDGSLVGFGGGLERKRTLLAHEASVAAGGFRATLW